MNMPMSEKGEWINPEDSHKERDEYVGHTVCHCNQGVHLHQAGYEVTLHMCAMCKSMVADKTEFFKFQDGMKVLSK